MKTLKMKVACNRNVVGMSLGVAGSSGVPYGFAFGFAVPRFGDSMETYMSRAYNAMSQLRQSVEYTPPFIMHREYNRDPETGRFVSSR